MMFGSNRNVQWRRYQLRRPVIVASVVIVALIGAYFAMLHVLDGRAERYFQRIRQTDPALYLTLLREGGGFGAYLAEYKTLEGYADFRPAPPSFLIGRWSMRDSTIRLPPGTAPSQCTNPVTFDYGLMMGPALGGADVQVEYRIVGDTVEMRLHSGQIIPIRLVSYGAELDHIEFTPPGEHAPVYAYQCGR